MSNIDYTEFLHNVKQEFIKSSYFDDSNFVLEIVLPVKIHPCPECGCDTKEIKDYRIRKVRFGAIQGHPVIRNYKARRYHRPNCKKAFAEANPFVQRYIQMSVINLKHL